MAINPLSFHDDDSWQKKPFYFMGQGENANEILITKNDRVYVRGEMLYVEFEGVNIYADINSAIIINTVSKTVMIKPYKELSPPEEREYLLLLVYYDEDLDSTYKGIVGRQNVFDYIKDNIETIDIKKSVILAETVAIKDGISIYKFMSDCIKGETPVENEDGFDIEEYNIDIKED